MAEDSWPSIAHPSVSRAEYEQIAAPASGDGIVGTPADTSVVYADDSGMNVKIRADKFGLLRGHDWTSGDTDTTKTVTANASGQTRVDLVVLRLDRSTWQVRVAVVAGIPGAGAPALTQDLDSTGEYEIPLAVVTVPHNDTSIAAAQVVRAEYYLGEPLTVCTAATRPQHAPGRRIYETDTGDSYLSTGAAWVPLTGRAVVCTSTTRPSHLSGLLIFETNTGRLYVSTGAAWRLVADEGGVANVAANTNMTLTSTLYRRNGWTYMSLGFSRGLVMEANTPYTVGTVPSGFRPLFAAPLTIVCPSGQSLFTGQVGTDGVVTANIGPVGVNATRYCQAAATGWPSA